MDAELPDQAGKQRPDVPVTAGVARRGPGGRSHDEAPLDAGPVTMDRTESMIDGELVKKRTP